MVVGTHLEQASQCIVCDVFRYTLLFLIALLLSIIVCHFGQLMPWYFLFGNDTARSKTETVVRLPIVAVAIAVIFVLPTGIVQAVTNQTIGKRLFEFSLIDWCF